MEIRLSELNGWGVWNGRAGRNRTNMHYEFIILGLVCVGTLKWV